MILYNRAGLKPIAVVGKVPQNCIGQFTCLVFNSAMKRSRSEIEESECETRSPTRRRIKNEDHHRNSRRLVYPVGTKSSQPPAMQYPYQLTTFSYSSSRKLEFSNAAMRYYVEPPLGADLSYEYDAWIKRPEERGRLDGLLEACLRKEVRPERARANVVSWRGVMTK